MPETTRQERELALETPGAPAEDPHRCAFVVPVVAGVVITGSSIDDNQRVHETSGAVRGFDAVTGALRWTFDRLAGTLPSCTAVSLPLMVFRAVMLAWAVWLAWALVKWLRWGFDSLTAGGGWRKPELKLRLPGLGRGAAPKPGEPDKP